MGKTATIAAGSAEQMIDDRAGSGPRDGTGVETVADVETEIDEDLAKIDCVRLAMANLAAVFDEDYVDFRTGEVKNGMDFHQKVMLGRIVDGLEYLTTNALKQERKAERDLAHEHQDLQDGLSTKAAVKREERAFERAKVRAAFLARALIEARSSFQTLRGEEYVPYSKAKDAE